MFLSFLKNHDLSEFSFSSELFRAVDDRKLKQEELTDSALLITDRFDFADSGKQSVCEVLMSVLPTSVENNAVTVNGRYRISANAGTFRCERIPFEDAGLERDWNTDACFRLMLECDGEKEICIKVEKI